MAKPELLAVPKRPEGMNTVINSDKTKSFVIAGQYSSQHRRILAATSDDVETEISLRAYDNMEKDSNIIKCKRILITSVLADDLQFAPGATEEEVGKAEYETYVQIMQFCESVIDGLDKPYRDTCEQELGNAIKYGHGIAEIEWEYRLDAPSSKPPETAPAKKSRIGAFFSKVAFWRKDELITARDETVTADGGINRPQLKNQKTRLMPRSIKVKPRNAARFVVDDFMNVLGLVPVNKAKAGLKLEEVVDRDKFCVLTLNKVDEDPRGKSMYRPAVNWYNLKTQIPSELLRFILEEIVPKAVGTLPENMPPFEFERNEAGEIVYEADGETPKMLTGAESFKRQIEGFRSGAGAVIPYGAKLEPYKKGLTGSNDAELFNKTLKIIDTQTENAILLQTLAQSEGEHQARSASEQVALVLYNLVFWLRWQLAMMTLNDLLATAVRTNFGEWALRYLPMASFGDFVRRDWVSELEAIADAYFKGFIDDSQRAELMAWLNLPKPGQSRQEQNMEAAAKQDVNGQPSQPNNNRPDKQPGTEKRNTGNGTEKKRNAKQDTGRGPSDMLGHHTGWFRRYTGNIRTGRR